MNTLAKKQARDEQRHKRIPIVRWTHIDDELPTDPDELILFCDEEDVYAGYYNHEANRWQFSSGNTSFCQITHWAHLPLSPHKL